MSFGETCRRLIEARAPRLPVGAITPNRVKGDWMRPIPTALSALAMVTVLFGAVRSRPSATKRRHEFDARAACCSPPATASGSTSLRRGMSYAPVAAEQPSPPFDNVFVIRSLPHAFVDARHLARRTVLVLEIRGGTSHGSILQGGSFQTASLSGSRST
jgi:hypothetical protein